MKCSAKIHNYYSNELTDRENIKLTTIKAEHESNIGASCRRIMTTRIET